MATINGAVSHWFTELPQPRPALPGDRDADVCIVGAGYTGLWTAYYLKKADPSLRITILEARFAGFGASGRNGGWLSGLAPGHRGLMAKKYGRAHVVAWQRTLNDAVGKASRPTSSRAAISRSPATPRRPDGCARKPTRTASGAPTASRC
jgi:choline dehydrogenase-like flavoprotein